MRLFIPSRPFAFRPRVERLDDRVTPAVSFAAQQTFATGGTPSGVAAADFNGDGRPDLATAEQADNAVSVRLNDSAAGSSAVSFAARTSFPAGNGPTFLAVADFNTDGRPDLVVPNPADNTVSVLLNTTATGATAPSFAPRVTFATTEQTAASELVVADFNTDGRPDIALTVVADRYTSGGQTYTRYQLGTLTNATPANGSTPAFAPLSLSPDLLIGQILTDPGTAKLVVGDFNGDGAPDHGDVFSGYGATYTVGVSLNVTTTGEGRIVFGGDGGYDTNLLTPSPYTQPENGAVQLAVGDFNADGRSDVAVSFVGNAAVVLLMNTTPAGAAYPQFGVRTSTSLGQAFSAGLLAGDFSGDGRTDLAALNATSQTASVVENATPTFTPSPTFAAAVTAAVGPNPTRTAAGDFNGDGRLDLVALNTGNNTVSVLLNTTANPPVTAPSVTGQFGTIGVWRFNRAGNSWDQLTEANATMLVTAPNGSVAGNFGGNGLWYFNPAYGWYQLHNQSPTALAMDGSGNVYAGFAGYGTFVYRLSTGWSAPLTSVAATHLAVNAAGQVAAQFPGYGLYTTTYNLFNDGRSAPILLSEWRLLSTDPATAVAIAGNGDVVASFASGVSVFRLRSGGWEVLNGVSATSLAAGADGTVVAHFAGYGVARYTPVANSFRLLVSTPAVSVAADVWGRTFASFDGYGVWEYSLAFGWRQRRTGTATLLGVGG